MAPLLSAQIHHTADFDHFHFWSILDTFPLILMLLIFHISYQLHSQLLLCYTEIDGGVLCGKETKCPVLWDIQTYGRILIYISLLSVSKEINTQSRLLLLFCFMYYAFMYVHFLLYYLDWIWILLNVKVPVLPHKLEVNVRGILTNVNFAYVWLCPYKHK